MMGTPEDVAAEKYFTPPEVEVNKCVVHHWEKRTHHGPPQNCDYWDCPRKIHDGEICYLELYPEGQCMTFCLECAAFFMAQAIDYMLPVVIGKEEKITMWERNVLNYGNCTDDNGNPTGGHVYGPGLTIDWQDGPLGRPPKPATGAFVEDVIEAARQRLEFYQEASGGKFRCRENSLAITKLEESLHWLTARRMEREARGVQGEYKA